MLSETLLQYNAMQKSNFELLLAKEREQQEEQFAIEALRDYWIARARLETALGGTFNPPPDSGPVPESQKSKPAPHEDHKH